MGGGVGVVQSHFCVKPKLFKLSIVVVKLGL